MTYNIRIGDKKYEIEIGEISAGTAQVDVNGSRYEVVIENYNELTGNRLPPQPVQAAAPQAPVRSAPPQAATAAPPPKPAPVAPAGDAGAGVILAPIPGLLLDIKVTVGEAVLADQTVATMEAMKMENAIVSEIDGTVKEIRAQKGSELATGDVIMVIG